MSALGAVSLLVPGPKMIWQFGRLGWEKSIFLAKNGSRWNTSSGRLGWCREFKRRLKAVCQTMNDSKLP
jgi:hypothetical protein